MIRETRVRQRLPADVRIRQILDAAFAEFSTRGFTCTRIDDIAARAGVSKGGIYTHFDSKEEVLHALLERLLLTSLMDVPAFLEGEVTLERVADLLAGELYEWAVSPPVVAMLRLLIAENARLPSLVEQWQERTENRFVDAIGKMLTKGIKQGHFRPGAATQTPLLLIAPIAQMCLRQTIRATPFTEIALIRYQTAYRQQLMEMLSPSSGDGNGNSPVRALQDRFG
ncbi:transcriptional regulator, TetR family [Paraburkholderia diazotrophica]|uniref:Transcriptional regulator, TetR family n=2 Tax=Paraburkholderia diazotrophica TaxID=667676 RepID=A0A1H7CDS2_9BURK|nr:transcriptional regulator, TetR family [Paraburkholderia diazotrophica]